MWSARQVVVADQILQFQLVGYILGGDDSTISGQVKDIGWPTNSYQLSSFLLVGVIDCEELVPRANELRRHKEIRQLTSKNIGWGSKLTCQPTNEVHLSIVLWSVTYRWPTL